VVRNEELESLAEEAGRAKLDRITDDFCLEEEFEPGAGRVEAPGARREELAEGRRLRQLNKQVGAWRGSGLLSWRSSWRGSWREP
jgi:hypothetical protein